MELESLELRFPVIYRELRQSEIGNVVTYIIWRSWAETTGGTTKHGGCQWEYLFPVGVFLFNDSLDRERRIPFYIRMA
jgi:hypothetical protein